MALSAPAPHEIERELLAAVALGDQTAFAKLYDRLSPMLWSVALRMLQDAVEAEDVMQETFMYVWNKAHIYNPELAQANTWVCLILRNRCLDRIRSRNRRDKLLTAVTKTSDTQRDSFGSPVCLNVETRELGLKAREAMSKIPANQRKALELAYFGGHSHSEIAGVLGLPLGTVKSLIRQGLGILRSQMGGCSP